MTHAEQLAEGLSALGLDLVESVQKRLLAYIALLQKWNRVHNLTAVRDPKRMISHHLLDSLSISGQVRAGRVLDLGSGAGLPGIPLALTRPDLEICLLDSNHKKAAFLRQAAIELKLERVTVACERADTWQTSVRFDAIVSRAVADVSELVAWGAHLLAPGGSMLAMKGLYPHEELAQIPAEFVVAAVEPLSVPGLSGARHVVRIQARS